MKRILALTITIIMIVALFPTLSVSAAVSGDFEYIVYESGPCSGTHIIKYTGTADHIVIPATIDGHTVTGIGHPLWTYRSIFEKNDTIKSITISDGITHIWDGGLSDCTALTSISIPDSVTHVGVAAFRNCSELKSITIPCGIMELNKTHLSENAATVYADNLFFGCTNLTEIIVDADNPNYQADEQGILYNKDKTKLIVCPAGKSGTVKIPESVTEISDYAFLDCVNLSEITLPKGIKSIGRSAFEKCTALAEIVISEGVESIGTDAFVGCVGLTEINIPGSVKSISSNAFRNLESLKTVVIQYGVKDIGHSAFNGCTSLTSIDIPDSLESIGNYAFMDCVSLTSLIIPDSVTSIATMCVFENCTSLTDVKMSDNVKEIGYSWFDGCNNLKSINIPKNAAEIGQDAFRNCTSLTSIEIPIGVTKISDGAFYGCAGLTSVDIPYSVKKIECYAFMGCANLGSIQLPNLLSIINQYTFSGCKNLTSIDIPANVKEVKYAAFENCTNLASVVFNNPDTIIEENGYIIPALNINPRDGGHPEIVCPPTFDGCDNLMTIYGLSNSTAQAFAYNQEKDFVPIVKVQLNGIDLSFDVPPQLINDRTMVPMRKIFEALGAEVEWNESTEAVIATSGNNVVKMQINNPVITVDDESMTLDVPPQLVNNRTLVPLRAVAEGLAAEVEWDGENQTVIITKEGLIVSQEFEESVSGYSK